MKTRRLKAISFGLRAGILPYWSVDGLAVFLFCKPPVRPMLNPGLAPMEEAPQLCANCLKANSLLVVLSPDFKNCHSLELLRSHREVSCFAAHVVSL